MREISLCRVLAIITVTGLALPVAGQATRSRTGVTTETNVRAAQTPYTAEYKITRVQVLANGTTITRETTEVRARDAQGRLATTFTAESEGRTPTTHITVYDPAVHTQTSWTSPGKRATVTPMPAPGAANNCSSIEPGPDAHVSADLHRTSTKEDLGTASIQGIEAHGRRITTTTPAGAEGNDAPLVRTMEIWTAVTVGLKGLSVRDIMDDPRSGKMIRELTNLRQGDPDPGMFQLPEGYEIVTKEASACQTETTAGTTSSTSH
jgi:hypothetical protein